MAIVVVGGHTRNIGKTSVVVNLIAELREMRWTAFKVTQFGHGVCSANGGPCDCETDSHAVAVSEERCTTSGTDTARFLAAGAVRCFWVRTQQGQLAEAMPRVRKELAACANAILESNSIVRFLRPDLYLAVLDSSVRDFKPSAQYVLDRADAVLWSGGNSFAPMEEKTAWPAALQELVRNKPQFFLDPNTYKSDGLTQFVAQRLARPKDAK